MRHAFVTTFFVLASTAALAQVGTQVPSTEDLSAPPLPTESYDPPSSDPLEGTPPGGPATPPQKTQPPTRRGSSPREDAEHAPPPPVVSPKRLNRITTGPLSVLAVPLLGISLEYERALTEKVSLFAGPRGGVLLLPHLSLSIGARYFPVGKDVAPAGFWFGPELWSGYTGRSLQELGNFVIEEFLLGMVGYTLIYPNGFTMSFGAGIGGGARITGGSGLGNFNFNFIGNTSRDRVTFTPSLAAHFNLGYAF